MSKIYEGADYKKRMQMTFMCIKPNLSYLVIK